MTDASEIKKKGAVCHPPPAVRLDNLLRVRQAQLRYQSRLPPHRRIWPPGRSGVPACLSLASADRLCAICSLSHALVWEYNIHQALTVARHAASGAWL